MSFVVNNKDLNSCSFNSNEVQSIYYNNTLIWEKPIYDWVGWENATWEDIYNMCQAKREGILATYPEDVYIGQTKTLNLSTSVNGKTSVEATLIAQDVDGRGVLTFHVKDFGTSIFGSSTAWSTSTVRNLCQNVYKYCDAKNYIKPLIKGTHVKQQSYVNPTVLQYTEETVWLFSKAEIIGEHHNKQQGEFTQGITNKYFASSAAAQYGYINYFKEFSTKMWVRSLNYTSASEVSTTNNLAYGMGAFAADTPTWSGVPYGNKRVFAPAFAIG